MIAELNLKLIQLKLKFHVIDEIQINQNQDEIYQITGLIQANNDVINSYKNRAGKFIIATNRLERESFNCDEMLLKYKEQQHAERGFVTRS
ncbi:transposase (fragment) [Hyella patelloides LEGE 07179]|uniref:Transposase n=1 Tax=Hyella patelloides LEGE 07179 TaxID=945734 RepID=A0A563W175_9CYAN